MTKINNKIVFFEEHLLNETNIRIHLPFSDRIKGFISTSMMLQENGGKIVQAKTKSYN